MKPKTYSSFQIALHWLLAVLVTVSLVFGTLLLQHIPNDFHKIAPLRIHMIIGMIVGLLIVASIAVRLLTPQPERSKTGNGLLDTLAVVAHAVLRIGVLGMVVSGIVLGLQAGLFGIVFGNSGGVLPHDFWQYRPRQMHYIFAQILIVTLALHLVGALFHQFVKRDKLFARMGVGSAAHAE